MYDFTSSINRARTGSIKIDMAPEPVKGSGLVPLTIADQEFAVAPEISDAVCKAAAHGIYGYTYADSEYRSAVNSWMLRRHNWNISKHKLFTVNGVVTALGIAVRALTTEGDGIVIQPPFIPRLQAQYARITVFSLKTRLFCAAIPMRSILMIWIQKHVLKM